ncbi:hypothetical protein Tco_0734976 [Tanacetum coccineum]
MLFWCNTFIGETLYPKKYKKNEEPKRKVTSKRDWFTKPKQPQEATDPDWNVGKTPQQGPTQSSLMTLASSADKPSKTYDELISTPLDFSAYIMNVPKITNLTQETLLGPSFKLLKGTHTNFAELEYDFEECYKALLEKHDWDNPQGGYYPFDLTKPLPLVMNTKAAQYDLPGIKDMVPNIWSPVKVAYDKHAIWGISHWRDQRKTFYGYARGLESSHDVYSTKRILAVTQVKRRWSPLEKKRAHIMIKAIDKQLKERRMMRSFEKFVSGRHYRTDLRLLQQTI